MILSVARIPPIVVLSAGVCVGVVAGHVPIRISIWQTIALALTGSFLLSGLLMRYWILLLCFFLLGFVRTQSVLASIPAPGSQQAVFEGRVLSSTVKKGLQELRVKPLSTGSWAGDVLVSLDRWPAYSHGTHLRFGGVVEVPTDSEDFSYRRYLKSIGVTRLMRRPKVEVTGESVSKLYLLIQGVREKVIGISDDSFPEPHSTLLVGILIGVQREFSPEFEEQLRRSGLLHIVVVSGYNMMIVASSLSVVFKRAGRGVGILFACIGILFYTAIVGVSVPVLRASMTAILALFGRFLGRQRQALHLLLFSACCLLLFQPLYLTSVSFQLSYAASAGLLLFSNGVIGLLHWSLSIMGRGSPSYMVRFVVDALGTSLVASFSVLPVIAVHFNSVSLVSILANVAASFSLFLIMFFGGLVTLQGVVLGNSASVFSYIAYISLDSLVFIAQYSSSLRWSYVAGFSVPSGYWVVYYGLVCLMGFLLHIRFKHLPAHDH